MVKEIAESKYSIYENAECYTAFLQGANYVKSEIVKKLLNDIHEFIIDTPVYWTPVGQVVDYEKLANYIENL